MKGTKDTQQRYATNNPEFNPGPIKDIIETTDQVWMECVVYTTELYQCYFPDFYEWILVKYENILFLGIHTEQLRKQRTWCIPLNLKWFIKKYIHKDW